MKTSYRIIKLTSGEEIIAKMKGSDDKKMTVERPMVFRSTQAFDILGNQKEVTFLKNWLGYSNEIQAKISDDSKELEQKLELENFKTKDRSENADGGRIGLKTGMGKAFLEFLKKFKVKQSGDGVSEFLDKRKFLKSMVGETEKNKKARELRMLKDAMEDARENPGFKFKDVDVEKDIRPIFDKEIAESLKKNRKLNATGGLASMLGE